jgi:hypothetical protein
LVMVCPTNNVVVCPSLPGDAVPRCRLNWPPHAVGVGAGPTPGSDVALERQRGGLFRFGGGLPLAPRRWRAQMSSQLASPCGRSRSRANTRIRCRARTPTGRAVPVWWWFAQPTTWWFALRSKAMSSQLTSPCGRSRSRANTRIRCRARTPTGRAVPTPSSL